MDKRYITTQFTKKPNYKHCIYTLHNLKAKKFFNNGLESKMFRQMETHQEEVRRKRFKYLTIFPVNT